MFTRLLIFTTIIILSGCAGNREKETTKETGEQLVIEGTIANGEDQLVTLDLMGTTAFIPLDSVRCDQAGEFSFQEQSDGLNFYSLKYTEHGYITIIGKPGDHIRITGNAEDVYPYRVDGSEASELVRELAERHREVLDQLREISLKSESIARDDDYAEKKQELNNRFDSVTDDFHRYSKEFIYANSPSPALLISLYNQFGPGLPVFHPLDDLEIYKYVDSVLFKHYPENEAVRSLHSQLSAAIQQMKNKEVNRQLQTGEKAPDFVMETMDRQKLALTDLRGDYVLLQFWASWSKPSVDENRFLELALQKFSGQNFKIVSISIDENREAWMSAAGKQSDHWFHVSDLLRWSSPVVDLYRVDRIPANFLVNPAGTIVEKDIFGVEIIETIQKYID